MTTGLGLVCYGLGLGVVALITSLYLHRMQFGQPRRVCEFVGRMVLKSSKTHLNKFERGNIDEFFVEVDNIGELRNIR